MAERRRRGERERRGQKGRGIDCLGEDLLQNVLSKLPALSFAYASCVNRSWNALCNRILSRPKLASALSSKSSQKEAIDEVLEKVLSEPIRPDFAVVFVGPSFCLQRTHKHITEKLGSNTPTVTVMTYGIMGKDALSDEFKEIQFEEADEAQSDGFLNSSVDKSCGIVLTVGFVPGMKVGVIPMSNPTQVPLVNALDNFVMEIRDYPASISGCTYPQGILVFGELYDLEPALEKLDYAMPLGTAIAGELCSEFLYRGDYKNDLMGHCCDHVAVALVFVRDKKNSHGMGEIHFRVALSPGLSPIGPIFKAVSVRKIANGCRTWLTAKREGFQEQLDGQAILSHIYDEIGDRIEYPVLYIGVKKRRKCSIGSEKVRWVTRLSFHEVQGGDQEYLLVGEDGIKTGDSFRFYLSDAEAALSSLYSISDCFKQDYDIKNRSDSSGGSLGGCKKEVFGGIIFSCTGRGESFFKRGNVDGTPFLESFPGIALAGSFNGGEIGCSDSSSYGFTQDSQEQKSTRCCIHVFSTIYFIMSYTPQPRIVGAN